MARATNPRGTRYRLTLGERGAMRLPPQAAGMTYHHIIPYNELRDFWNTAVGRDPETLRQTLVSALRRAMDGYPLDQTNPTRARALLGSAGHLLVMIEGGNYVHDPAASSAPGMDDLSAIYSWMPGNLFSGPTNRANDPEEGFDSFASRFVEESQYVTVLRAHQAIRLYLDLCRGSVYTPDAVGTRARARDAQLAHAAGLALARVAQYGETTPYDPSGW
jgi:hypothetical protein